MRYELATQHPQIRIGIFPMRNVAVRVVIGVRRRMEGVARGVYSHKSKSTTNGIEQRLFPLWRHRRVQVFSGRGQISSSEEKYRRVLPEIAGVEDPAVFGCGHVESVVFPQGRDRVLDNAW